MTQVIKYPTHPLNLIGKQPRGTKPLRRPACYTPRERFALECARGTPKFNSKGEIVGSDGELPSIKSYNSQVSTGLLSGSIMSPKIGTNW